MTDYKTSMTCQIPTLPEIYKAYFGEDYIGSFVEVGAFDGITYSNTYGLAELGWKGLYIEAVPEYAGKCRKTHDGRDNIKVVNACVGQHFDNVELMVGGEYSTYNKSFADNKPQGWGVNYGRTFETRTMPLDAILMAHWEGDIDLLVIDVEGSETDVLKGFWLAEWKPRMVIIEAHEQHRNEHLRSQAEFINAYFSRYDYRKIYSDDCNNIYVRCDGQK